ncbi:MAG: glucose 1-dehydrogenase [Halieaceae bacterium]|nr:glucose 1-dehydrogenase [Halieaceae bacterium]
MNRLNNKVAIITGGASGIGKGIAQGFVKEGALVCIADIDSRKCEQVAKEIGSGAIGYALDVTSIESINALVNHVMSTFGEINVLVNSAGVFGMQMVTDVSEEEFDRIYGINIRGLLFMTQVVAKTMIATGNKGAVVNIASGSGRRAAPGASVYSSSKGAVISFTQGAAQELVQQGIRVNAIAPGMVMTPMWKEQVEPVFSKIWGPDADIEEINIGATPAGRFSTPDDYIGAAIFLASDESDFVVGQTLNVDGGYLLN